jgi:hypothetical protein
MRNIAVSGSGSGSIRQRHGSQDPDPDPPQNVMDPQHCSKHAPKILLTMCNGVKVDANNFFLAAHVAIGQNGPPWITTCKLLLPMETKTNVFRS